MKRILCLIDTIEFGGGAERQMTGLASFLGDKGYCVDLVSYHVHKDTYIDKSESSGCRIILLQVKNNKWSKLTSVKRFIQMSGGYDCMITYKDGPNIIGCLLKLIGINLKLIVSERSSNKNINIKEKIKFFLYRFADYIVPNSYTQNNFIMQRFPNLTGKLITITNFTDVLHYSPVETAVNNKIIIMTAARIVPEKNILNYIDAIKILKENGFAEKVHFDWFGNVQLGMEKYKDICIEKCKNLDIEDMFEFHNGTKDIIKYYQTCDIFCLPSVVEGYPNVICEAMSCGKPIICGRVCDNPFIVQENKNGLLFDPTDVNSIYLVLKQIIEMSHSKKIELGEKSRAIAESLFSKDVFVQKYVDLIEN